MGLFSKAIGIDLGTANILVHVKGKGIVIREPSVVAINQITGETLAVGNQAKEMIGRTPGNIIAVRPLKDGVIADFSITQSMLKYFIRKGLNSKGIIKPRVVICVPSGVTEVEKRAVEEAGFQSGAKAVYLIEEPMAAAIGAGLNVEEPSGCMVVDIGGGTSEVAVISLGGIVTSQSLRTAGDKMDSAISAYIKKEFNILIGERTAELIKVEIGSAYPEYKDQSISIKGRDLLTGLPKSVDVHSKEVLSALKDPIHSIVEAIKNTLERTPPELASDIMKKGITLTGGGALLSGLDVLIKEETGMPVTIAEFPLDCVALGTGKVIESINTLKKVLYYTKKR